MRELGILTVAEVDDNYLSNPNLNIFMRQSGYRKEDQEAHARAMASMDRVVFSTELLRDIYWAHFKQMFGVKDKHLPEPFVCRNNIDVNDWPEPISREGPLRVGWMGSPSHVWDVNLAWPALRHAQNLGCETVVIGFDPTRPNGALIGETWEGQSHASAKRIAQWKEVRYRYIGWTPPSDYHRAALPLDIGLCPLKDTVHTRGKSDAKFLEYSISGAAVIAQDTPVYSRTIRHGETGLLVKDAEEMAWAVDLLVHDEPLRMSLVNAARRYVYEERGLKQLQAEWGAALSPS